MKEGVILEIKKSPLREAKMFPERDKKREESFNLKICDRIERGTLPEQKGFYELKDFKLSPADPDPYIIEGTNANFKEILKTSELPVMVDFYNPG